jgi:hypothetical protein
MVNLIALFKSTDFLEPITDGWTSIIQSLIAHRLLECRRRMEAFPGETIII